MAFGCTSALRVLGLKQRLIFCNTVDWRVHLKQATSVGAPSHWLYTSLAVGRSLGPMYYFVISSTT